MNDKPHIDLRWQNNGRHMEDTGGSNKSPAARRGWEKEVLRGFGCRPRIGGNRAEFTERHHRFPVRLPWWVARIFCGYVGNGRRIKVGRGPCDFFRKHLCRRSSPHPAIRLHLKRDPVNRPPGSTSRERAGLSRSLALQDRASGVRGGRAWCDSGRARQRRMTG
jgi:hypothetical protein